MSHEAFHYSRETRCPSIQDVYLLQCGCVFRTSSDLRNLAKTSLIHQNNTLMFLLVVAHTSASPLAFLSLASDNH